MKGESASMRGEDGSYDSRERFLCEAYARRARFV